MNATDRLVVGGALIAFGVAAAVAGWPMPGALVGFGLGTALSGLLAVWRERRSGEPS
ncbi:hypothetical protein AB0I89_23450 [Micromonospora sp. NPDC049801]|uniref:hypothetical protein n=1 Tax=unclassified Micromonospora TaxID=2617518 RepID=UPI0033DFCFB2